MKQKVEEAETIFLAWRECCFDGVETCWRLRQARSAGGEGGEFCIVEELDETERGEGGYGHTGVK